MTTFRQIDPKFPLEGASFGEGNSQVVVIRLPEAKSDHWQLIPGTRVMLIGGARAKKELRRLFDARREGIGREELQARGVAIGGRTHHRIRQWLELV